MENKSLLYIRYRRKSSEDNKERQAASLEEQTHELDQIEIRQKIKAIADLEESKTAHTPGREVFNTMMEQIARGEANAILTWHPNRLARNPVDGGHIVYMMDEGKLLEIRTPSRVYHNTPEDKFMLTLEFGISKKDSDDKAIAVKRGLDKKLRDGWRPGVAPEGYLNDRATESGFRRILVDEERMPFIKKIFELFSKGTPVIEIQQIANEEWHYRTRQKKRLGGKPLGISTLYWILRNPFYSGKYKYSGQWYEGKHETAVSPEMFDAIQIKLGTRSPYKLKGHDFAFSGMMKCGICGSGVIAEEKWQCICSVCKVKFSLTKKNREICTGCGTLIGNMENPTILHYVYYRCGKKKDKYCLEKGIRVDLLEEQILEKLGMIDLPESFLAWAKEQLQVINKEDESLQKKTLSNKKYALSQVRNKLQNLLQLMISPENADHSLLSNDEYRIQKQSLEQEVKKLEQELGGDEALDIANERTIEAISFAVLAQQRFKNGDAKVKRNIFIGLGLHPTLEDRRIMFDSPKHFVTIAEMKKAIDEEKDRVARANWVPNINQMYDFSFTIPTVLRG